MLSYESEALPTGNGPVCTGNGFMGGLISGAQLYHTRVIWPSRLGRGGLWDNQTHCWSHLTTAAQVIAVFVVPYDQILMWLGDASRIVDMLRRICGSVCGSGNTRGKTTRCLDETRSKKHVVMKRLFLRNLVQCEVFTTRRSGAYSFWFWIECWACSYASMSSITLLVRRCFATIICREKNPWMFVALYHMPVEYESLVLQ